MGLDLIRMAGEEPLRQPGKVLAGVVEIDDVNGAGKVQVDLVFDPFGPVGKHDGAPGVIQPSLASRVLAVPSACLSLRPATAAGTMGMPVPSSSTYSVSQAGPTVSPVSTRCRWAHRVRSSHCRISWSSRCPMRSMSLGLTAIPADARRSSAAASNGSLTANRATNRCTPGDQVVSTTPSSSSPGNRVLRQRGHWNRLRSNRTLPNTVSRVLALTPRLTIRCPHVHCTG